MSGVFMRCGHTTHGKDTATGEPVCVVCYPHPASMQPAEPPNVEGRLMRCTYAMPGTETHSPGGGQYAGRQFTSARPSNPSAAFFASKPREAEDAFYCGCFGWD